MKNIIKFFIVISLFELLSFSVLAVPVDLELGLLVDVSGSINSTDFNIQRSGYEAAFRDTEIISAIENGAVGSIAVTMVYWSASSQQRQVITWNQISDSDSANSFADAIAAAGRPFSGGTGIAAALNFSVPLFSGNGFEGTRQVIDISGDGTDNQDCISGGPNCVPLQNARDAALNAGIDTINGLVIFDPPFFGGPSDSINAEDYFTINVIGGDNSFVEKTSSFNDFGPAVRSKILSEINPPAVPEPSTVACMAIGLIGLAISRRGKRS